MQHIKKLFAIMLVLVLVGTCTISVFAASAEEAEEFASFRQISKGSSYTGYNKALQRFLYCYPDTRTTIANAGGVDGVFGTQTKNAVIVYQEDEWPSDSSKWDGIVGSGTWRRIGVRLSYGWDPVDGYDLKYAGKRVIFVDTRAEGARYFNYNEDMFGTVYVDTFFHDGQAA